MKNKPNVCTRESADCALVSIRGAKADDAASIARLAVELGYPVRATIMRSRVRAILASAADLLIVAVDSSGAVVGWLQAHAAHIVESGFRVEITGLIITPASRRRGVGRSLVANAEQWARTLSAEAVVVRSNSKRAESHCFYPSLGYTPAKTQVVYRKPLAANAAATCDNEYF